MWRHEDIWRTLGGGIDFITGEALADEWEQSRRGQESAGMVRLCAAPLIHGAAQVATLGALFSGDTVVLTRRFDPHEVWREIERRKVNVMMVIGDAMARPLIEAYHEGDYDASSLVSLSSSAALFSPVVKDACAAALPNVFITEAIGSTETGFAGMGLVTGGCRAPRRPDRQHRPGGRRAERRRAAWPGRARSAGWPGAVTCRSATTRTRSRRRPCSPRWTGSGTRCRGTGPGSRRTAA